MTTGVRHDDLRRRNREMVVAAVRRADRPSRTEIASATGLSNSTISAISADLIAEGVLLEVKAGEASLARRGRPQVAIGLDPGFANIVAVTLTLNHLSAVTIDYAGHVVHVEDERLVTGDMGRDALVAAVSGCIARAAGHAAVAPSRISLAVQGITDSAGTTMLWSPITAHTDIAFGPLLEARFRLPVTVENDCNMIALALKARRPDRYRDDFFAILLSNGIGMGIMLKGRLFTGTHSSGAEFGHMIHIPDGARCRCGRHGCIEAYAGNYAVLRNALGLPEHSEPAADIGQAGMQRLADLARASDGPERAAFMAAGRAIGFGLGSLFALFDPAPVAIVGHGAHAFDILERPIRDAIASTAGGEHSGAISFEPVPDEMPLIREGSAISALSLLDREIVARGAGVPNAGRRTAM